MLVWNLRKNNPPDKFILLIVWSSNYTNTAISTAFRHWFSLLPSIILAANPIISAENNQVANLRWSLYSTREFVGRAARAITPSCFIVSALRQSWGFNFAPRPPHINQELIIYKDRLILRPGRARINLVPQTNYAIILLFVDKPLLRRPLCLSLSKCLAPLGRAGERERKGASLLMFPFVPSKPLWSCFIPKREASERH